MCSVSDDDKKTIKKQITVIEKLRDLIMEHEIKLTSLQNDCFRIAKSNRELEFMIQAMKDERTKLLEELEDFKQKRADKIKAKTI